ncbi:MAG: hypothetical protein HYR85_26140 [Planctomycetes bacterium]|nr:hypothetical protein [Planctomycetota bacterium]MBI3848081.1 hypothetical protein [Planctomycetota bacterium]
MKEFRIPMTHRPGELTHVAGSLARHDVNVKAVAAVAIGNQVVLHLIASDHGEARTALEEARIRFDEAEVVPVLIADKAGELEDVSSKLGSAGINIEAIYMTGRVDDMVELALAVDNVAKAKKIFE